MRGGAVGTRGSEGNQTQVSFTRPRCWGDFFAASFGVLVGERTSAWCQHRHFRFPCSQAADSGQAAEVNRVLQFFAPQRFPVAGGGPSNHYRADVPLAGAAPFCGGCVFVAGGRAPADCCGSQSSCVQLVAGLRFAESGCRDGSRTCGPHFFREHRRGWSNCSRIGQACCWQCERIARDASCQWFSGRGIPRTRRGETAMWFSLARTPRAMRAPCVSGGWSLWS
mmetsp:Transcript_43716/g.95282  ORF Transcript_43716/g.95282 Transcript_43716/m.95282 type:complete len:224 (+) Transcript_43716:881-1552(+)